MLQCQRIQRNYQAEVTDQMAVALCCRGLSDGNGDLSLTSIRFVCLVVLRAALRCSFALVKVMEQ